MIKKGKGKGKGKAQRHGEPGQRIWTFEIFSLSKMPHDEVFVEQPLLDPYKVLHTHNRIWAECKSARPTRVRPRQTQRANPRTPSKDGGTPHGLVRVVTSQEGRLARLARLPRLAGLKAQTKWIAISGVGGAGCQM
jgi:hypothetical protein